MATVTCPKCGLKVRAEDGECFACGAKLPRPKIEPNEYGAPSQDTEPPRQPDFQSYPVQQQDYSNQNNASDCNNTSSYQNTVAGGYGSIPQGSMPARDSNMAYGGQTPPPPITPSSQQLHTQTPDGPKDYNGRISPMSIIGFILSISGCLSIVGLILGIIDLSKKDGRKRGLSLAAVIIGAIAIILSAIITVSNGKKDTITDTAKEAASAEAIEQADAALEEEPTPAVVEESASEVIEEPASEAEQVQETDTEALREAFNAKLGDTKPIWYTSVHNDVTGNWRELVVYSNKPVDADLAMEYYDAYFDSDDEIHWITNLYLKTVTRLSKMGNILNVATSEYQDGEENDAKKLGGGMALGSFAVDMDTRKEIKTDGDPDAGTVDNDALTSAVKEAIDGQVAEDEKITGVDFDGSNLTITVDLSNAETKLEGFTKKDIAEARISSITDAILAMDDKYYNTWETITLDFGPEGKATFSKSSVKNDGYGRYFDVPMGILE